MGEGAGSTALQVDTAQASTIDQWLKKIRLHKYSTNLTKFTWEQVLLHHSGTCCVAVVELLEMISDGLSEQNSQLSLILMLQADARAAFQVLQHHIYLFAINKYLFLPLLSLKS